MPDPTEPRSSAPRFEIVHERDVPRRRRAGSRFALLGAFGAIRSAIETVYVTFARGVMQRTETVEDALAARRHARRVRQAEGRLPQPASASRTKVGAPPRRRSRR